MHKLNFYFIDDFDKDHIKNLPRNIAIIYRNYNQKHNEQDILSMKKYCIAIRKKFYLANNIQLAEKLSLDGAYIPSFNKNLIITRFKTKNFTLLGSAHNIKEINQKIRQKVDYLFISPIFKITKKKKFLGIVRFNILSQKFNRNIVALGGINKDNLKMIKNIKNYSFASISYIKNIIKR
jgi:thiamine-phosphate pyrophosphorylase